MHLSLDSSVEHASSMDLQPSTKEIWISYQNWLRCRAHCSYFNSLILSDFRLASQGAVCICFFFFFPTGKKQNKTTKNNKKPQHTHSQRPSRKVRHVNKIFFFFVSMNCLFQNHSYTVSKLSVRTHTHTHTRFPAQECHQKNRGRKLSNSNVV